MSKSPSSPPPPITGTGKGTRPRNSNVDNPMPLRIIRIEDSLNRILERLERLERLEHPKYGDLDSPSHLTAEKKSNKKKKKKSKRKSKKQTKRKKRNLRGGMKRGSEGQGGKCTKKRWVYCPGYNLPQRLCSEPSAQREECDDDGF